MRTFTSLDEVSAAANSDLGPSEWFEIDQDRINTFADATLDHQWIHVDPVAAAAGPFQTTIAHGFLTLSLLPHLGSLVFALDTPGAKLNYGLDKVRFPSPVAVGSKVRAHVRFGEVKDVPAGKQLTIEYTVEIQGQPKPACVASHLVLLLP